MHQEETNDTTIFLRFTAQGTAKVTVKYNLNYRLKTVEVYIH